MNLIKKTIFNILSHPSEVTAIRAATIPVLLSAVVGVSPVAKTWALTELGLGVDVLFDVGIVMMSVEDIVSEFVSGAIYLVVALVGAMPGGETDVGADMDAHGLAAVKTASEFEL